MADAIHSAADSFATFFAWLGLKIAQKTDRKISLRVLQS